MILNKKLFQNSDIVNFIIISLLTALTRLILIQGYYEGFGWDPGSFALASKSYSVLDTRPHLPGYFLHVLIIKYLTHLTGYEYTSMIFLSITYSSLGLGFMYLSLRKWFQKTDSILLTLIIMTNPFVWYYSFSAEMYAVDLFISILIIKLCMSRKCIYSSPIFCAIASGIRPSSVILLLPLYIYFWYQHYRSSNFSLKNFIISHVAGLATLLLWFIPMVISVGGIHSYIALYKSDNPIPDLSLLQNIFQFSSYLIFVMPPLLISIVIWILQNQDIKNSLIKDICLMNEKLYSLKVILILWIIPPMLFFTFIHYAKGYLMLCIGGILVLVIFILINIKSKHFILISIAIFQTSFFLLFPYQHPNTEVYFRPEERNISLPRVWFERTISLFLMSYSKIESFRKFSEAVDKAVYIKNELNTDKKYIFLDPTCIISTRALQVKYPDKIFTKLILKDGTIYGLNFGLDQSVRSDISAMLTQAIIISNGSFVNNYIPSFPRNKITWDDWIIYTVSEDDAIELALYYKRMFIRN